MNLKYTPRLIFNNIKNHLIKNKEITLLIGPRQVGKTVLLQQLQSYLQKEKNIKKQDILNFNLDIFSDQKLFTNQSEFIEYLKQKSEKRKIYVFIDEAQKIKEAGVFLKGVYDSNLNIKLILTGSSNLEIRAKIHESLTGRKRVFYLLPFSFLEILNHHNPELNNLILKKKKIFPSDLEKILKYFFSYCIFGGYPQVVLSKTLAEKQAYLKEIFSSYLEKDIISFLRIENEHSFIKLVKLLASQCSNLININNLSTLIGTDRYTVNRYISILEKTFVNYNLIPFFNNPRQEIIKASKIYFYENGLRNLGLEKLEKNFLIREDKGVLLENTILKELLILQQTKNFSLRFWRTKNGAEVDFILEKGLKLIPLEVKTNLNYPKLEKSFLGFLTRYNPEKALIVNLNFQGQKKINKTQVYFIFPWELDEYI